MKLFFTFILSSLACLGLAQTLTASYNELTIEQGEYIDYGSLFISSSSDADVELGVTLTPECYVPGDFTSIQICMGDLCFAPVNEETTWASASQDAALAIIPAGQSWSDFKFDPFSDDTNSSAWIVTFFDRNNPDDNVAIELTVGSLAACSALNINEAETESSVGHAYPNPVTESVTIPFSNLRSDNASVVVYNSIGAIKETIIIEEINGEVILNTSEYANGVYFYQIIEQNGTVTPGHSFIK